MTLEALEARLKTLLPEEYQDRYESIQPTPMGSTALKYAADGRVAWNDMWASFCDLAMAGGPPHKGSLLSPAAPADIDAAPDRYAEVVAEICRGLELVTDLPAFPSPHLGWVRLDCLSETMAGWLLRAIAMENVAVRRDGKGLDLPASPAYRLEKEIKNVITVAAKTCHYWLGHIPRSQQRAIGALFAEMAVESPLIEPDDGWSAIDTGSVMAAVWMMRMLVGVNVLSRREGMTLFVPVNHTSDPGGAIVARAVAQVQALQQTRRRP